MLHWLMRRVGPGQTPWAGPSLGKARAGPKLGPLAGVPGRASPTLDRSVDQQLLKPVLAEQTVPN